MNLATLSDDAEVPPADVFTVFREDDAEFAPQGDGKHVSREDCARLDAVSAMPSLPVAFHDLRQSHPHMRPFVIAGLLRTGETLCLHGKAKSGKSWAMLHLLLSIASGGHWLERFGCQRGRVLLIDNELHPETIVNRVRSVAEAMELTPAAYESQIDVLSLRGELRNIYQLAPVFEAIGDCYQFIALDALYRMLPEGCSENDNAGMAAVFNCLDAYAKESRAALGVVHHQSKGEQSGKDVVDVGSGAGAFSRAVDAHLVLRQHDEPEHVVFDGRLRSTAGFEPFVMRFAFPRWVPAEHLDPEALKGRKSAGEERQTAKDRAGCEAVVKALADGPLNRPRLMRETGFGKERLNRILAIAREAGDIEVARTEVAANGAESDWFKVTD